MFQPVRTLTHLDHQSGDCSDSYARIGKVRSMALWRSRSRSIGLIGQRQFASGIDDASDDHCQAILYPGLFARVKSELPIVQPFSTGLACHCDVNEVIIIAACEVI